MEDHRLPRGVRLGRRLVTPGEVREGVGAGEDRHALRSAFALAAMTRNASALVDELPVLWVRALRIVDGLRGNMQSSRADKRDEADDQG